MKTIKQYLEEQLDRYDEVKSTAVQVVEELPTDIQNRVYITEDEEDKHRVYAKDIELQQADSAVLTVNEQEMDENQNITVDGSNTKATYEEENDYIDNLLPKVGAVKEVEELPASPDKRVYIDKDKRVYAKDVELQTVDTAVQVNWITEEEWEAIAVKKDNHFYVVS